MSDTKADAPAPATWALLVGSVIVALLAFWGGIENLFSRWIENEEYSHGFFIPIIAGWMLWHRKEALVSSFGRPVWSSFLLLAVALALLFIGELSAVYLFIQIGFLLAITGIVLSAGGMPLLRVTLLPIAFLIFTIPLPYFINAELSWRLQLLSSELGVSLLRIASIAVHLQGNVIDLGTYKLQVVEACSGLRYLYPFLSLGFLAAYLYGAPLWQRVAVFLSTIPITVVMNSARIAFIGVMVSQWGSSMAEGALHFFEGWLIFMACGLVLGGEIWILARLSGNRAWADSFGLPVISPARSGFKPATAGIPKPLVGSLALLFVTTGLVQAVANREEMPPPRTTFSSFPMYLDEWHAHPSYLDLAVERGLGVDDYILADFERKEGEVVNLYVAYYASQRKGVSPHSPRVCIPGGGWMITDLNRDESVNIPGQRPFPINRTIIQMGQHRQLVYYWFEARGRRLANEYLMKANLLWDSVTDNRTDGALVRLTTPLNASESIGDADKRLQSFMDRLVPKLSAYVPN